MAKSTNSNSRLVYSTEHGRSCPVCGKNLDRCTCREKKLPSATWDSFFLSEERVTDDFMSDRASQEQPEREAF